MQLNYVRSTSRLHLYGLLLLIRPRQWLKNAFVLAPLLFSGKFLNLGEVYAALIAALLFCIASSAAYIINDIHDIERDRRHPQKSVSRPLASGIISKLEALHLLALLYLILACAWFFVPQTVYVIAAYLMLNYAYTLVLKHQPVVDIFAIAICFVLRVYAGAVALSVPLSGWMAITTLCLALYLAAIKRRQELVHSGISGRYVLKNYSIALIDRYAQKSATGAVMFYSLFVMSQNQKMIITIPLVLFGLFRYWYIVETLDGGESPTDVLIADKQIMLIVVLWCATCLWILWPLKA
ncbi:decaprenyl-phosphate phosphoribosyltransferase [Undibacterium jejuense]|uniref:Decaprenyl-phosphate phosphoribosyltransferase n=1 Tax=Undibacterium jejuense TaxID=1344949 RepID=A0A923KJI6_9BURK|nr:decaprenyl-phosphate phosphoribosyltransferase [Undibacterium jejuense]MBC3864297.1 decaprenyl-phosphate phosphoribosyltransferase [Undibacterium jejuense]